MTSRVKGQHHTRPINGDTHRPPYLQYDKAYKLQTWYTDGGRRLALSTDAWPPRSKVKVAKSRGQSEPSWCNAVPVSLAAGRGMPCQPNPVAMLLAQIRQYLPKLCSNGNGPVFLTHSVQYLFSVGIYSDIPEAVITSYLMWFLRYCVTACNMEGGIWYRPEFK